MEVFLILSFEAFFLMRLLCLKTVCDGIFLAALLIFSLLDTFAERNRVCHYIRQGLCLGLCIFSIILCRLNLFFDPAHLTAVFLWLTLLIYPYLTNRSLAITP